MCLGGWAAGSQKDGERIVLGGGDWSRLGRESVLEGEQEDRKRLERWAGGGRWEVGGVG